MAPPVACFHVAVPALRKVWGGCPCSRREHRRGTWGVQSRCSSAVVCRCAWCWALRAAVGWCKPETGWLSLRCDFTVMFWSQLHLPFLGLSEQWHFHLKMSLCRPLSKHSITLFVEVLFRLWNMLVLTSALRSTSSSCLCIWVSSSVVWFEGFFWLWAFRFQNGILLCGQDLYLLCLQTVCLPSKILLLCSLGGALAAWLLLAGLTYI